VLLGLGAAAVHDGNWTLGQLGPSEIEAESVGGVGLKDNGRSRRPFDRAARGR
jgi:hypothetical protein